MKRAHLLAAIVLALQTSALGAEPRLTRGTQDLSVHVAPDFEGPIGDTISAQAGYGRFVRDRWLLRAVGGYQLLEDVGGPDGDYKAHSVELVAEVHLPVARAVVLYLGASAGWTRFELDVIEESALTYGPRLGVKFYLAPNAALDTGLAYRLSPADAFVNDFRPEDTDLTGTVGLRLAF
jgi:hypothetical protein